MSIIETAFWSLLLLLILASLGLVLVGGYRTIRRRQSADDRTSQEIERLMEQGRSYAVQRNFDQAISAYEKVMARDPHSAQAYSLCGLVHTWQGEHRAAIAHYDRALELNPNDAATHMQRGWAYQQLGDAEMALADLDRAVTLNPDDPIIRLSRLKFHQELGNTRAALADLEHVMAVSPEIAEKELARDLLIELRGPRR